MVTDDRPTYSPLRAATRAKSRAAFGGVFRRVATHPPAAAATGARVNGSDNKGPRLPSLDHTIAKPACHVTAAFHAQMLIHRIHRDHLAIRGARVEHPPHVADDR